MDEGQSPEVCAAKLVKGMFTVHLIALSCNFAGLECNHTYITSDILGDLFRNAMRGVVAPNYWLLDPLLWLLAPVSVFPGFYVDKPMPDCCHDLAADHR